MGETVSELKACPFCGGADVLVIPPNCKRDDPYDLGDHAMSIARCRSCYAEATGVNWDATCDSAIAAWNRRSTPDAVWAEVERLREALREILADMPIIDCDRLHHAKKDRHGAGPCPVEIRLEAAIVRARAILPKEQP